jgi:NAD(P)-dependent dehydrogenase (short-subunit alcohol dehydrogenase family)
VARVTGGGRGLGRAIALALAAAAARAAVVARTRSQIEAVAAEMTVLGAPPGLAVPLDVTDASRVPGALAEITAALGPVDILVNSAGIAESAPLAMTDDDLWERHMRLNVDAPYRLTRQVLPGMLERRWGRVINIASVVGLSGAPYVTAYATSKHALVGFTRALAAEVSGRGVTVNAICPGYAATDLTWNAARNIVAKTGKTFEAAVEALARLNAGGRLIEPAEVAAAAVKLASDEGTNGETVVLDGA